MEKTELHPQIFLIEDFLTSAACDENEKSFYTFLIYLNDDFEGGETEFENLFTVTPKKGSALVFYHPVRHEGKILISGNKYVLRTDVMYSNK